MPLLERPKDFRFNKFSPLATGLVFAGLGFRGSDRSTHYRDSSPYGNHGTLTNMEPETDWEWDSTLNRFALNCRDAVCYVLLSKIIILPQPVSFCCFAKGTSGKTTNLFLRSNNAGYKYFRSVTDPNWVAETDINGQGANCDFPLSRDSGMLSYCYVHANDNLQFYQAGVAGTMVSPDATGGFEIDGLGSKTAGHEVVLSDPMIWNRVLSLSEIQQLADPSNVMLSGLILPPRRKWWPVVSGGGAIQLVVQDSECLVASESPSLVQHYSNLTVGGCESVVESESPALTQHQVLAVGNAESLVESEVPTLTQHHVLTVADNESLVESESPALTQHHALTVGDAESLVESEAPALTQHQSLTVADSECLVESDEPTLTYHAAGALVVQDSECVVESDLVVLTQHQLLQVLDTEILVTSETVTLGGVYQAIMFYHPLEGPSKKRYALEGPSKQLHPIEGPSKKLRTLRGPE